MITLPPSVRRHKEVPVTSIALPERMRGADAIIPTEEEYRQRWEEQQQKGLGTKTMELLGAIPEGLYSVVTDQWIPALQDESLIKGLLFNLLNI